MSLTHKISLDPSNYIFVFFATFAQNVFLVTYKTLVIRKEGKYKKEEQRD